jgi:hypothetical protein
MDHYQTQCFSIRRIFTVNVRHHVAAVTVSVAAFV